LSLLYLVFYFLGSFFIKRPLKCLTIPFLWVMIEFLKESIWCGFGWANLGYSQFNNLYLIQIADLGGTKLISFVIVLVNFLIWKILIINKNEKDKNIFKLLLNKIGLILIIFITILTYSFYKLNKIEAKEKIEISVVQTNILDKHLLSEEDKVEILKDLSGLVKKTPRENLVIFPEAAWPYTVDSTNTKKFKYFAKNTERNILIGVITESEGRYYNSVVYLDKQGNITNQYDKINLVPFGEYVPLRRYLKFIKVLNSIGDITPGQEVKTFTDQDNKFSVLICFEDIFPNYVAKVARGKDFLVNITDDSWFYGQPEAGQHLSIMVLRAIENRISIVRSANTGISGWVSPQGQITKLKKAKEELFVRAKEDFKILTSQKRSFYNKRKGWFVLFSFLFLLVIAFKKKVD
ncbi:MAG: apolipoprotein N-acyltransferase, partial [Candidatus Omnitrophica bacterium]|nr:apolipoprotein N-acyltransferase [Candidatus Omnitrophota bacterium]